MSEFADNIAHWPEQNLRDALTEYFHDYDATKRGLILAELRKRGSDEPAWQRVLALPPHSPELSRALEELRTDEASRSGWTDAEEIPGKPLGCQKLALGVVLLVIGLALAMALRVDREWVWLFMAPGLVLLVIGKVEWRRTLTGANGPDTEA